MKTLILNRITQEDIMQCYFPDTVSFNKNYKNPWRDDKTSGAYFDFQRGKLLFIDWANTQTHMDCFYVAEKALGLDNFKDTCNAISKDFNLGLHRPKSLTDFSNVASTPSIATKPLLLENKKEQDEKARITIVTQKFNEKDLRYWLQYGIKMVTLIKFGVRSCHRCWVRGDLYHEYSERDPMYVYTEKDNDYKIYRPRASKMYKWRSNMTGGILECWEQLPETGELLILTKSRKDVMTLYECGYTAVASKSESSLVSNNAINLLKNRFKHIVIFYDNDEAGRLYSEKLSHKYSLNFIELPQDELGNLPKDPSDYTQVYDQKSLKSFIDKQLREII